MENGIFKNHRDIALLVILMLVAAVAIFVLNYVTGSSTLAISAVASFALVLVTAVLALYTHHYTEAANKQAEATNRQVDALTNPILNVDIHVIERSNVIELPMENVVGVPPTPVALEVFIQNVGPGNACEVTFDVKDNFTFVVGGMFHNFNELNTLRLKRLAPGQRRSLALIILSENADRINKLGEMTKNKITVTYKNATGHSFPESFLLDFSYNVQLIIDLKSIPYTPTRAHRRDERQKTPAYSRPLLDLTKRDLTEQENEFLLVIYDCVKENDVTRPITRKQLNKLTEKIGVNELDAYRYTMLLKAFGLVEVDFLLGGAIADLKLTSNGVLYIRRLGSE